MQQDDFILKSGAKLHMSSAAWEKVVDLWSAVKPVTEKYRDNPVMAAGMIMPDPGVQTAVRALFPWATWNNLKVSPQLFDDPKHGDQARMDYLEICEKLLEFNLRPFFLMTYSGSTATKQPTIENPEQP